MRTFEHNFSSTRVIMTGAIILAAAVFLSACNVGSSNPAGSSAAGFEQALTERGIEYRMPPFPETTGTALTVQKVSDSATLTVWQVTREGEIIHLYYTYEKIGEPVKERTLVAHEDAERFLVYDDEGVLLGGYHAHVIESGDLTFTYVQDETILTVRTNVDPSSGVEYSFFSDQVDQSVAFTNDTRVVRSLQLLRGVEEGRLEEGALTPAEAVLLEKARIIKGWGPQIPQGSVESQELEWLDELSDDEAVVGPGVDDGSDPATASVAQWICRAAKLIKYVCEYVSPGYQKICDWVNAIDAVCTALNIR